jgi:hypothetical protein
VFPVPVTCRRPGRSRPDRPPRARTGGSNNRRAVLRAVISGVLGLAFTYGIRQLIGTAIG